MTRAERENSPRGVNSGGRLPTPTATPPGAEVTSTITDSDVSGRCWRCGTPFAWTDAAALARCAGLARDALEERAADGLCPACAAGLAS